MSDLSFPKWGASIKVIMLLINTQRCPDNGCCMFLQLCTPCGTPRRATGLEQQQQPTANNAQPTTDNTSPRPDYDLSVAIVAQARQLVAVCVCVWVGGGGGATMGAEEVLLPRRGKSSPRRSSARSPRRSPRRRSSLGRSKSPRSSTHSPWRRRSTPRPHRCRHAPRRCSCRSRWTCAIAQQLCKKLLAHKTEIDVPITSSINRGSVASAMAIGCTSPPSPCYNKLQRSRSWKGPRDRWTRCGWAPCRAVLKRARS